MVLGAVRVYRVDFTLSRPFPSGECWWWLVEAGSAACCPETAVPWVCTTQLWPGA